MGPSLCVSNSGTWAVREDVAAWCLGERRDSYDALTPVGSAHGNPNDYVTYAGLKLKKASGFEYGMAKALGGTMW
jgi:hypothetical protein